MEKEAFSDYIVYVDESGDHSLKSIDPQFPVFVLLFCIVRKIDYCKSIVPAVQELKFKYFGHDMIVFHEREIHKRLPPFDLLMNGEVRKSFIDDINDLIASSPITLVASCIDKPKSRIRRGDSDNPYHIALEFGLERVFYELQRSNEHNKKTHVVFETRGKKEDKDLELETRRILDRTRVSGMRDAFEFVFASKLVNSTGLQLADLIARPVGRYLLKPDQANRAVDIVLRKFRKSPQGEIRGWGLKCYP